MKTEILNVRGLCKHYPSFDLRDVSFSLRAGKITGFIGRNGAGKSTTLCSVLGLLHPDAGEISFFGTPWVGHENEIKQRIGFVSGGVSYYPNKKLRAITGVTKAFYPNWDEDAYRRYLSAFSLDENKTPAQLSAGMQVKYAIALALSHHAELLILDEPTSGLDPISRDELLDVFMDLSREGTTILFSTHITSDLDRCADDILSIRNGKITAFAPLEEFVAAYRLAVFSEDLPDAPNPALIGARREKKGYSALIRAEDAPKFESAEIRPADLEAIMIHLEKEERA